MLGFHQAKHWKRRDWRNAMGTLQTGGKPFETSTTQVKTKPVITVQVPVRRMGNDAQMMYAWSIGTTRAAQERPERMAAREQESRMGTCPPEVYIG
jgi:hypothetical protein